MLTISGTVNEVVAEFRARMAELFEEAEEITSETLVRWSGEVLGKLLVEWSDEEDYFRDEPEENDGDNEP